MPIWKAGQSGNLMGRPKGFAGLAKYIRESTENGQEIVDFHLDVLRGKIIKCESPDGDGSGAEMIPTIRDRQESAEWLANRAFGTAPQAIPEEDEMGKSAAAQMTNEELLQGLRRGETQ